MLTPTDVRRLLRERGLAPRKSAGQNFVIDPNTVRRIVEAADIEADDVVVEIGPGLGSLTLGLADRAARVIAIEIDAGFVAALGEVLVGVDNVEVVHADALEADLGALLRAGGNRRPARLVANLPYNVATPLVVHALADDAVGDLFVMVQREVGERWGAPVGHPLRAGVSVKLDLLAEVATVMTIPRAVFHPVPNVDSVMVRLSRRADAPAGEERDRLFGLVDLAFAQRRKTLRNTLRPITADAALLASAAAAAGIDLGRRAETLSTLDVVRLDRELRERGVNGASGHRSRAGRPRP